MRISDWSSDLCSSDVGDSLRFCIIIEIGPYFALLAGLVDHPVPPFAQHLFAVATPIFAAGAVEADISDRSGGPAGSGNIGHVVRTERTEGRREGKELGRTCRSRWSPDQSKKKQ